MGCLAQKLFLTGDYAALDALMVKETSRLGDLPDGSSHLQGIAHGLGDLFEYGDVTPDESLQRIEAWRRAVKGSAQPALVEPLFFRSWAYAARGVGYASSVSPQAMEVYLARAEMAAMALRDAPASAHASPLWYESSLAVGRDQSIPEERRRAIFDEGMTKFPDYIPLYQQMLTNLMPRWGGSIWVEDEFIAAAARKRGGGQIDPASYARLYLIYGNLEGDDLNVLESAQADEKIMKAGVEELRKRYPRSDYILNAVARYYCIDNEYPAYHAIRPLLDAHPASAAWPDKLSIASCDKWSGT